VCVCVFQVCITRCVLGRVGLCVFGACTCLVYMCVGRVRRIRVCVWCVRCVCVFVRVCAVLTCVFVGVV